MKHLILILLTGLTLQAKSQTLKDTLITYIDTINVNGKVVNQNGAVVKDAVIIFGNDQTTKSDKNGLFRIVGFKPNNSIIVDSNQGTSYLNRVSSRYLLVRLAPSPIVEMNADQTQILIAARKLNEKPKYRQLSPNSKTKVYDFDGGYGMGDRKAEYPGGARQLYKFLSENIIYPKKAVQNSMEGLVTVEFVINAKGFPENFLVTKDIGYGCAEEVIKALKIMSRWNPGIRNGKPIRDVYSVDVPFKLLGKV
ncbi:hypothetical protein DHW03_11720 [Pedobacter yonginense]|uniref:TonB C-terminal domain-containing protein n=1 Tax=Pedobacter yonginense TaxID=651869 RepID=A0A317EKM3_9SPHI|nr:energy transducer TonB [Pedobacter yonginense]PWS26697.1 hypothetical protein DHW03_11720 [Pedobacter yonginense]